MALGRLFSTVALSVAALCVQAGEAEDAIRKSLSEMKMDVPAEAISASPMAGLYQIEMPGGRLLYASADGQFLMQGFLFQLQGGQAVNLTQAHEARSVAKLVNSIDPKEMVIFSPAAPKTHITVFTDTDCGYCQKLHSEIPELNRLGVEVRYVAFPREGQGSHGYNTLVSVWCSADRKAAMNLAKARKDVPAATCDNPIMKQYALGQQIGVNGTPAIVLANGQMIPGYQPAPELAEAALKAR